MVFWSGELHGDVIVWKKTFRLLVFNGRSTGHRWIPQGPGDLNEFEYIMIVVTITGIFMAINYQLIYTLGFLYINNSGSANAQLPGCFCPWTFSLNIGLNMFPLDSFMSCLHSILGYSTGEFQALQLIVLAAFAPVCWSTFWKSSLKW